MDEGGSPLLLLEATSQDLKGTHKEQIIGSLLRTLECLPSRYSAVQAPLPHGVLVSYVNTPVLHVYVVPVGVLHVYVVPVVVWLGEGESNQGVVMDCVMFLVVI